MSYYTLIATSAFGIESVVADELRKLGYNELTVNDGRVIFTGDETDIARCNIWLRCADRVLVRMAEFPARDFEELYQGVLAVEWEKIIPENGIMHVKGKSVRSTLHSVSHCQSITKKAVVEAMKRRYKRDTFPENGPLFTIEVGMLRDTATITLDTSGPGLHKRGYRVTGGEAPIRETLAAAIIYLSRWTPDRIFADPLCGSGTIAIEAAMKGLNIAPGLRRSFVSETWNMIPAKIWNSLRSKAEESILEISPVIFASDMDTRVFRTARENAEHAGVGEHIIFQKKPVEEFSSKKRLGCIVTNPPYGERLGKPDDMEHLYRAMGDVFRSLEDWSYFILCAHPDFEKHFGMKSVKNRKLYNGKIKTYLYQYFGPLR